MEVKGKTGKGKGCNLHIFLRINHPFLLLGVGEGKDGNIKEA